MTRVITELKARADLASRAERGFTLIELLVVVIIIGILAAIAIPIYIGVQNNAKDSAVKSDLGNLKTAETAYYSSASNYVTGTSLTSLSSNGYSQSATSNYAASGTPKAYAPTPATGSFCIAAISATGTSFAASDAQALAKGSCTTAGVYSSTQVSTLP